MYWICIWQKVLAGSKAYIDDVDKKDKEKNEKDLVF